jgi:hypothetical protein
LKLQETKEQQNIIISDDIHTERMSNINNLIRLEYTNEFEKVNNVYLYIVNTTDFSIIEHFFIYDSIGNLFSNNIKIVFPLYTTVQINHRRHRHFDHP